MNGGRSQLEALLVRLEAMAREGVRLPLTARVVVDSRELLDILAQVRQSLPEEIRAAAALLAERDELLQRARQEADAIVAQARETVAQLADETAIAHEAQQRADQIVERSREVAKEIHRRALSYADEVLERLESHLQRTADNIRRHREELRR